MSDKPLSKSELERVEKFADTIFAKVGIDVKFTRHFLERVNDSRNGKQITMMELIDLFKKTFLKHGTAIPKLGDDAQAILNDKATWLNLPFVLVWDRRTGGFNMFAKSIMRKKDFKSKDPKFSVENREYFMKKLGLR